MQRYANLGGDSGVTHFEIGSDCITVRFSDGSEYEYTNASTGPPWIAEMQRLALEGQGLNSFISRVVKKAFSRRIC